jgi:outer membrane protein assembly factor BamB
MRAPGRAAAVLTALTVLAGCAGQQELILPGVRYGLDVPLDQTATAAEAGPVAGLATTAPEPTGGPAPIALPAPVNHAAWTHRNGGVTHAIAHPALAAAPRLAWSVPVGQGETRRHRITASPVAADGRVFTLDAQSGVMAHDARTGAPLWSRDLTRASDRARDASGGKLAVAGGTLFATTGFGDLYALDAATGAERWRQRMDAPMGGGVTVAGGLVYTVTRDGRAWALDAETGRIRWELAGTGAPAVLTGGPSPIVTDRLAVFPFANGDLVAALKLNGIRVWQASVSGSEPGRAGAVITDVTGDPVLDAGRIHAGNFGGRTIAFDAASGARLWTARHGALGPVWPVGGSVFLVSPENLLVRLDADTGAMIWTRALPYFVRGDRRPDRWREVYVHYGPVLAGGRLWLASSDGLLRGVDPASGSLVATADLPGGAASAPIVVNGVMYVVSRDGRLHAFR